MDLESVLMNYGLSSKLCSPTDGSWMLDGSEVPMGQNLSCKDKDVGWAITESGYGSNLGGDVFLVNLDELGSLDHTCICEHNHKQVHQ